MTATSTAWPAGENERPAPPGDVTQLLAAARLGDRAAVDRLFELVVELRFYAEHWRPECPALARREHP